MKDEDERRKRKSEKMGVKRLGRKSRTRLRCNMGGKVSHAPFTLLSL